MLPLVLTAAVQALSASDGWKSGPSLQPGVRSLFIAIAVASVVAGRSLRTREVARRPLGHQALLSLSWRLLTLALVPVAVGAVLSLMTRSVADFYILLLVTLVGLIMLYPRYDQWTVWATPPTGGGV